MTPLADSVCVHHWRIETPNGSTSPARCRKCRATRAFSNSVEHSAWTADNRRAAARGTAASAKAKKSKLTTFWHGDIAKQAGVPEPQPNDDDEDPF